MEPRPASPRGGFATRAVHAATVAPVPDERPLSPPIHPSSTWGTDSSAAIGELLQDQRSGYVYGRYDNPTQTVLHGAFASLHGAEAAWSLASGTAAIHATLEALRGDGRILATSRLYGGTHALLARLADRAGWDVETVDVGDPAAVAAALTPRHRVLYVETIANPSTRVADLPALAAACSATGTRLVVDNTFASPWLCRPLEHGADVVIESATKFLGGHGDVVGGVVAGDREVVAAVREATYELGGSLGPFEAWLVARGIQTLPLRMRACSDNAAAIAGVLAADPRVAGVRHPTLPDHPDHDLARRLFDHAAGGGVLSFDAGSRARAEAFADACQVFVRAASLGATHSLVLHPASSSHRQLDESQLRAAGLTAGTVRLSVGIEQLEDLVADVRGALDALSSPEESEQP